MKQNNRKQVKLIVKERFSCTKPPQDILSDIIISEMDEKQGNVGLSNILDSEGSDSFIGRAPVKRTHREIVGTILVGS